MYLCVQGCSKDVCGKICSVNKFPSVDIWFDESKWTILVVCECDFRELVFTKEEAMTSAKVHRLEQHPNALSTLEIKEYRDRRNQDGR